MSEITKVVFRVFKDEGDVIALFPYIPETRIGEVLSYQHVGQHGAADYNGVIRSTRPAKPEEYAALKKKLESAPYRYKLKVIETASHRVMNRAWYESRKKG